MYFCSDVTGDVGWPKDGFGGTSGFMEGVLFIPDLGRVPLLE